MKTLYTTDLSDAEWALLKPYLPASKSTGRPRTHAPRQMLDAIFYILRSGCPWRLLPRDFPPWKTVYHYFRQWRLDGTFERLNAVLRERLRLRSGRAPHPSAGILDSQSAKTTGVGSEARGYDGGKEGSGQEASSPGGYGRIGPQGKGPQRQGPPIRMGSSCCWGPHVIVFRASLTCGWTRATREGAEIGQKRH
jgi:transposase